jgi:hypothetical protein
MQVAVSKAEALAHSFPLDMTQTPEEILQILKHNKAWIITAHVFQIGILVIGLPGESSNI